MSSVDLGGIVSRDDFAAALTRAREAAGLSIRALARDLTSPPSTIGGYFGGRHLPPPGELARLLRACDVPEAELDEWLDAARRVRTAADRRISRLRVPYRGLEAFDAQDADLFFGRDTVTNQILSLLSQQRLVIVVGPSGSGKSSILRAGVTARLRAAGTSCAVFSPGAAPLTVLDATLAEESDVLVVDQFEEVFTLAPQDERAVFLGRLATVDRRVVLGLRADFYESAAGEELLLPALQHAQVLIGPMGPREMREAITRPAEAVGGQVDPALVDVLLAELNPFSRSGTGALPLLSHALLTAWERASGARLTVDDYRATGGIDGAVQETAEEVFAGLTRPQRELTRRVFQRLVSFDGDRAVTRRQLSWDELDALDTSGQGQEIVGRFVDRRLLTAGLDHVEIGHEALLSAWPRLREWITDDRIDPRLRRRITEAANDWFTAGEDPSLLWRGVQLEAAMSLRKDPLRNVELTTRERHFTDAGGAALVAETSRERRRSNRLRLLLAVSVVLILVAGALGLVALRAQRSAASARDEALSREVAETAHDLSRSDPALSEQLVLAAYRVAHSGLARAAVVDASAGPITTRIVGRPGPTPLAVSAGNRYVAVGDAVDGSVRLYRTAGSRPPVRLATIAGAGKQNFALAFSPDLRLLAAGGELGTVRLWSLANPDAPRALATLEPGFGSGNAIQSIAFNPAGTLLAASSAGPHPVQVWDVPDRRPIADPVGIRAGSTIQSVAFDPSGTLLAAGGTFGTVYLWRLGATGSAPLEMGSGPRVVNAIAFDPQRPVLYAGDGAGVVTLWTLNGKSLRTLDDHNSSPVDALAVTPDGRHIAVGRADDTLEQWLTTGNDVTPAVVSPGQGPVTGVAYGANGRRLYSTAADGTLRIRPTSAPGIPVAGTVFSLVYDRTGTRLAVVTNGTDGLRLWNPRTGHPYGPALQIPDTGVGGAGTMTPDGSLSIAGDSRGRIMVWDTRDPAHPHVLSGPFQATRAAVETIAVNPAGTLLAVASDDSTATIVDIHDRTRPRVLARPHGGAIMLGAAFNRDGTLLAGANVDNDAYVWDVRHPSTPRLVARVGGFLGDLWGVSFSPTENVLAASSSDHTTRLWDLARPADPRPLGPARIGATDFDYLASFSPDGRTIAVASNDHSVRLYAVHSDSATPELTLRHAQSPVFVAVFSPDGRTLIGGGRDPTLSTWTLDPDTYIDRACPLVGTPLTRDEWALYVPGARFDPPCR